MAGFSVRCIDHLCYLPIWPDTGRNNARHYCTVLAALFSGGLLSSAMAADRYAPYLPGATQGRPLSSFNQYRSLRCVGLSNVCLVRRAPYSDHARIAKTLGAGIPGGYLVAWVGVEPNLWVMGPMCYRYTTPPF